MSAYSMPIGNADEMTTNDVLELRYVFAVDSSNQQSSPEVQRSFCELEMA